MLGLFDKKAGKLSLCQVKGNQYIQMQPRIHGVKYHADENDINRNIDVKDPAALRRERNARYDYVLCLCCHVLQVLMLSSVLFRLIEEFGSQRRKRQLHTAQASRVDASQISSGDAMLHIIRTAKADPGKREDVIKESLAQRNIPPHNPKATTAEEAYPFDKILPPSISDSLDTSMLAQVVQDPSILDSVKRTFGAYVATRLGGISTFQESDATHPDRIKCLALLGLLLSITRNMKNLIIKIHEDTGGLAAIAEKFNMHTSTLEGILGQFYHFEETMDGGHKYILDKRNKNLMLAWCLVLSVRAEPDSSLSPLHFLSITQELKMKSNEVANLYRELGCTTKRASNGYIVTLLNQSAVAEPRTLEESFPALKLGGKRR